MLFSLLVFTRVDMGSDTDVSESVRTTETSTPCKYLKPEYASTLLLSSLKADKLNNCGAFLY
jgi:hypothetical protein